MTAATWLPYFEGTIVEISTLPTISCGNVCKLLSDDSTPLMRTITFPELVVLIMFFSTGSIFTPGKRSAQSKSSPLVVCLRCNVEGKRIYPPVFFAICALLTTASLSCCTCTLSADVCASPHNEKREKTPKKSFLSIRCALRLGKIIVLDLIRYCTTNIRTLEFTHVLGTVSCSAGQRWLDTQGRSLWHHVGEVVHKTKRATMKRLAQPTNALKLLWPCYEK